ncbi:MAG TPA: fibronectin type III domain-containing protein [Thermoanaerobaculia bacterium]|nr:fibronectin type III domain-containing protein [Thermoanaerobaculia bacterium]
MNKMRRTNQHSQRGMTLVEVIVATSIFIVILMAAMMIYDQSNKMFKTSVESADLQQNTRAGFDRLVADVRMAGFDADRDGVPVRAPAGPWSPNTNYSTGSVVSPTVANTFSYRAVTGGTSGALEPTWPTTAGTSFNTDGTVTWIAIGPAYQQADEQIEFAGRSAITLRGNLDYNIVSNANPHHGREIEYEPTGGQFPIVTTANEEIVTYALRSVNGPNPDTITFYADVTRPRSVYPGGSAETLVSIPNVDLCAEGCNNPPYTLMRFTLKDDGTVDDGTPVANNVRNLEFFYYEDGAGTTILENLDESVIAGDHGAIGGLGQYDPANVGGTANWNDRAVRAKVASVRVQLVGMNEQPDRRYTNPTETLASAKNFRTYNLESLVTPRNLGLSGMPEPDTAVPGPPTVTSVCVGACRVTRVRWNPPLTGNVETYEVRYDTSPTGSYNNIGVVVPGDVVSAPVFGLTTGTLYYFKVMAINENGFRLSDNYLSRAPINSTRPGPIANLTVTEGASAQENQITVSFTTPTANDPSLANMSCQGVPQTGADIDPAETIRYRIWRGTTEDFNPVTNPASAEVVLESTVPVTNQPNGSPGAQIIWIDDVNNALAKPPANCKPYYYRVQVYDLCSLAAAENNPANASTGQSSIFPLADGTTAEDAIPGYANSTVPPSKPADLLIDYTGTSSRCNRGLNTCDVKLEWDAVKTDTSNPTQMITVDQYRISRERKKASDTTWTFDTILPVLVDASSDSDYIEDGGAIVTYHDTTALDHDPEDRRKWYYRYTVTALQCGAESEVSAAVQFPASCGLAASAVIESGASAGDGSLASPWVMGAGDYIRVVPPVGEELDEVQFEVFPEPDDNPNNPALVATSDDTPDFDFGWESLSDGQVYRVVITMRNAAGCTEQTERFMMDDPINCASATITQLGSSGGNGTESQPWIMSNSSTDMMTVNAPSGSPIASVVTTVFNNPGNSVAVAPVTDILTPFDFDWPDTLIDNQTYRVEFVIQYLDGCSETFERFVTEEPPPVCTGATMSATGASSGAGTLASPWLVNGGDTLVVTPPVNGIVNQVVFTITPVSPAGTALPVVTDSASPYALAWVDRTDNTVYKIDAVITYAPGCSETITRWVQDQICAGGTVTAAGSTGAGTGLTTASPWVFDAGDTLTVAPPAGATITSVQFNVFNEPGTTVLGTSNDAATPFVNTWIDRVDDALYRVEIVVTYTAGCTETITRYVRDQGACFITASAPVITNFDSGSDGMAAISYTITNPTNQVLTVKGIKIDWLRATGFPVAVIESIDYVGAATVSQTVSAANGAPPTTGVLTAPGTVSTIPANSSTYVIRVEFNLGRKQDVNALTESLINKLCIQYTAPSLGSTPASCNVLGSTTGNPGACN